HILGHEENDFMRPMILNVARTVPKAPSALTASSINATRLDLAWKDNSTDETGFSIQRRAGGSTDAWIQIGAVVPNVRSYSDFTVADSAKYDYRVTAYNQAGDSVPSNIASVGVPKVNVSGTITSAGLPVSGLLVSVSDGQTALTDVTGAYTYSVPVGFTGTSTPITYGYQYSPAAYTYTSLVANKTAQDFTATPVITLSGRVTVGATALAGATITFSSGGTATTDASGNYSKVLVAPYTGTLVATKAGYFITPIPITITAATADMPGQNFSAVTGFVVSGKVTANTANGAGIPGVAVAIAGGYTSLTDATGAYSTVVPSRYSGTLTPSKVGYTFTPTSITLNRIAANTTGQNFTGRAIWPVTGTVTTGVTPLAGVTVTFSGTGGGTATTSAAGTYAFNAVANWSGTITPTLRGTLFLPASVTVANLAAARTQNFSTAQTIAGTTRLASNNSNVSGVTLTYTGTAGGVTFNGTVTSSATGTFTITVPTGWVGTVSAASTGRTWSTVTAMPMTVNANVAAVAFRGL
ncbi:MAG: fibronectin type III domain-containing protein, partial [Betaproteobacteria bacterium]